MDVRRRRVRQVERIENKLRAMSRKNVVEGMEGASEMDRKDGCQRPRQIVEQVAVKVKYV